MMRMSQRFWRKTHKIKTWNWLQKQIFTATLYNRPRIEGLYRAGGLANGSPSPWCQDSSCWALSTLMSSPAEKLCQLSAGYLHMHTTCAWRIHELFHIICMLIRYNQYLAALGPTIILSEPGSVDIGPFHFRPWDSQQQVTLGFT